MSRMYRLLLFSFCWLICQLIYGQTEHFYLDWAEEEISVGRELAIDNFGNVYCLASTALAANSSSYDRNITVRKHNANGDLLWSHTLDFGSSAFSDIALDEEGNAYVVASNIGLEVAKIGPDGTLIWQKRYPEEQDAMPGSVFRFYSGALVVNKWGLSFVGNFRGSAAIGSDSLKTRSIGTSSLAIVKLSKDGDALWANTFEASNLEVRDAVTDAKGDVYVTGYFWYDIVAVNDTLRSNSRSGFIGRFSGITGELKWIQKCMEDWPGFSIANAVDVNKEGNILVVGTRINLNPFLTVYSPDGSIVSDYDGVVLRQSFAGDIIISEVETDAFGNIYLSGHRFTCFRYDDEGLCYSWEPGTYYLIKFNDDLEVQWVREVEQEFGDRSEVFGMAINYDHIYITGYEKGSIGSQSLRSKNDLFIQAWKDEAPRPASDQPLVYPNPSASSICVYLEWLDHQDVTLTLFDVSGRSLGTHDRKVQDGIVNLDISRLPTGIYQLRVSVNNEAYWLKVHKI